MSTTAPQPKVLVAYYSATGNVATLAHSLAEGARTVGADVRVMRVAETAPAEAIAANPKWQSWVDHVSDPIVSLDDLAWCDGLAIGSPTRFGGPTAQMKAFLDTTGGLWFADALSSKVCTSFTSASTLHGGLESTILAINNHFYHWGSLIMPLGYTTNHVRKVSGNPYGASFVSRSGAATDEASQQAAHEQGERLATVTRDLLIGRQYA